MRYILIVFILLLSTGLVSAQCIDSDGGKNKYEYGSVSENGDVFEDECEGENIQEYFCTPDGVASYSLLECIHGCDDGQCQVPNNPPRLAPAQEESPTDVGKTVIYIIVIVGIIALYVYWFKIRKKSYR